MEGDGCNPVVAELRTAALRHLVALWLRPVSEVAASGYDCDVLRVDGNCRRPSSGADANGDHVLPSSVAAMTGFSCCWKGYRNRWERVGCVAR